MSEIGRAIRAVRRSVRVKERTLPVGRVYYRCSDCSMSVRVVMAKGVALPSRVGADDDRAPAPRIMTCGFCGGDLEIDESSYEHSSDVDGGVELQEPYLRVPSRRAGALMAASGRVEAQLVDDGDQQWE